MNAPLETVTVVGEDGEPLRINKSDYDADQGEGGAKAYKLHKQTADQAVGALAAIGLPDGISQPAAPAAPDFSSGGTTTIETIDANKNAVAPTVPSPGQKLVEKRGTGKNAKYFVVVANADGTFTPLTNAMLNDPAKPNNSPVIDEGGYASDKEAWDAIMAIPV